MFKNKKFYFRFATGKIVHNDSRLKKSVKDGFECVELEDYSDDYSSAPKLIDADDFTLEKQLLAGVQMNRINVGNLLDKSDPAIVQRQEENSMVHLYDEVSNETSVDTIPDDSASVEPDPQK